MRPIGEFWNIGSYNGHLLILQALMSPVLTYKPYIPYTILLPFNTHSFVILDVDRERDMDTIDN